MKNISKVIIVGMIILTCTRCAPVQFYSNDGLTQKTGLKYYSVKPFLHVERDALTGNIVKATVVYLPDLAHPQYMVIHNGLGSKRVNLKFTNGSINTFGYTSISKIGESVDALAAMISKSTDAVTDLANAAAIPPVKSPSNIVELYEINFGQDKTTMRKVQLE